MTTTREFFTRQFRNVPEIAVRTTPLPRLAFSANPLVQGPQNLVDMGEQSFGAIFRALPAATTPGAIGQLERRERIVFLLLDGKRTIGDVARLVHRNELDVARTIAHLLGAGYVESLAG